MLLSSFFFLLSSFFFLFFSLPPASVLFLLAPFFSILPPSFCLSCTPRFVNFPPSSCCFRLPHFSPPLCSSLLFLLSAPFLPFLFLPPRKLCSSGISASPSLFDDHFARECQRIPTLILSLISTWGSSISPILQSDPIRLRSSVLADCAHIPEIAIASGALSPPTAPTVPPRPCHLRWARMRERTVGPLGFGRYTSCSMFRTAGILGFVASDTSTLKKIFLRSSVRAGQESQPAMQGSYSLFRHRYLHCVPDTHQAFREAGNFPNWPSTESHVQLLERITGYLLCTLGILLLVGLQLPPRSTALRLLFCAHPCQEYLEHTYDPNVCPSADDSDGPTADIVKRGRKQSYGPDALQSWHPQPPFDRGTYSRCAAAKVTCYYTGLLVAVCSDGAGNILTPSRANLYIPPLSSLGALDFERYTCRALPGATQLVAPCA